MTEEQKEWTTKGCCSLERKYREKFVSLVADAVTSSRNSGMEWDLRTTDDQIDIYVCCSPCFPARGVPLLRFSGGYITDNWLGGYGECITKEHETGMTKYV